jgi:membrane-bound lytic murein transglycosylase B
MGRKAKFRQSVAAAVLIGCPVLPAVAEPVSYAAGGRAFAEEMVARHGLPADEVSSLLAAASYRQAIVDAMDRPYEAKPWRDYREIFLTPERIEGGVRFWRDNAALLDQAEAAFGVPARIIVAIIGIETNYGGNLGSHKVIDALTTLGFSYPRRAAFFRKELEQFLLLAREEQVDPLNALGSYAGALGKPQFIPSSYRAYAVDFDRDGRRDLWGSNADVIGSVGNYLARHGWRRGKPVAAEVRLTNGVPAGIPVAEKRPVEPRMSLQALAEAGLRPADPAALEGADEADRAVLLELDGTGLEYWLALDNFYAITRYNHSNLYAMAANLLGGEIEQRYRRAEAP